MLNLWITNMFGVTQEIGERGEEITFFVFLFQINLTLT